MDIKDGDEFAFLFDCAEQAGVPWNGTPQVTRRYVDVGNRKMSVIAWGNSPAEIVFLHGGAQNAHTWDTLALALQMPLVAVDLPGHGRSDWRSDHEYGVSTMAEDVAPVVQQTAPQASMLVGIGLGSSVALLTANRVSPRVERLVLVDSAPGSGLAHDKRNPSQAAANVTAFTAEHHFASFEEALARAVAYNPRRSLESLRRGVIHNGEGMPDGSWRWRWDPSQRDDRDYAAGALEKALVRFAGPILLIRGGRSDIVSDELFAAFKERHPSTDLITIQEASHAVQGSHPLELAEAIRSFWAEAVAR